MEVSGFGRFSTGCMIFLIGVLGVAFKADFGVCIGVAFIGVRTGDFKGVKREDLAGVLRGERSIGVYLLIGNVRCLEGVSKDSTIVNLASSVSIYSEKDSCIPGCSIIFSSITSWLWAE